MGSLDVSVYRFSVDQAVSPSDGLYVAVSSNIPSVIIHVKQLILQVSSLRFIPSLLITDLQCISFS